MQDLVPLYLILNRKAPEKVRSTTPKKAFAGIMSAEDLPVPNLNISISGSTTNKLKNCVSDWKHKFSDVESDPARAKNAKTEVDFQKMVASGGGLNMQARPLGDP